VILLAHSSQEVPRHSVTLFEKKNCIAGLLRQRHTGFQKRRNARSTAVSARWGPKACSSAPRSGSGSNVEMASLERNGKEMGSESI
jgi:hypothetical protein